MVLQQELPITVWGFAEADEDELYGAMDWLLERQDRIEAPWLLDGPINGERFRLYVEKLLIPTLKPGDIVIMDNLGSHKSKAVRQAIRAAKARLFFLPKYSPDLNPIERLH